MLDRDKRKLDDKQRPNHNGMYSGNDFDNDINKLSLNSLLNNFLISLDSYDEARTTAINQIKNLYNNYGNQFLDNEALFKLMKTKPHIEKLICYYVQHELNDEQAIIEKIFQKAYKKGYQSGNSDGYRKGYAYGKDRVTDDIRQECYEEGYEAGLDETSGNEGSAFNGYYGADGGFHEYNDGWEGE